MLVVFFWGDSLKRVSCFVDGFNLYHSINDLGKNYLKWLDLWRLARFFAQPPTYHLEAVFYFSALATWLPGPMARHREYIKALRSVGVTPVLSQFYEKPGRCLRCNSTWTAHEEKASDVKLALGILDGAYQNTYDRALLITRDSDIGPAVSLVRSRFPDKEVVIIAPPGRRHSKELAGLVPSKHLSSIKPVHLEKCLFPKVVKNSMGNVVAVRPSEYTPPL